MKLKERIRGNYKTILGKAFSFLLVMLSLTAFFTAVGSVSTTLPINTTDDVVASIMDNNKLNKSSFWTVRSSSGRNNWLGGDIKPWLYSLSSAWSIFDDDKHNHNFLVTFANQEQTFAIINDELIPISVIASPSPSSLSAFNFKIDEGKTAFDGKESFYISQSLFEKTNSLNCSFQIMNNPINIQFAGVINKARNNIVNDLGLVDYIVVPTTKAYDMENYTGKSTFVAVLFNDYYQNYYCVERFSFIDKMSKIMSSAYVTSYVDKVSDINKNYDEISSKIQDTYNAHLDNNGFGSKTSLWFVLGSLFFFAALVGASILYFKKVTIDYFSMLRYCPLLSLLSLILYSLIQIVAFRLLYNKWFIWTMNSQLLIFVIGIALSVGTFVIYHFMKKKMTKSILQFSDTFLRIDI